MGDSLSYGYEKEEEERLDRWERESELKIKKAGYGLTRMLVANLVESLRKTQQTQNTWELVKELKNTLAI